MSPDDLLNKVNELSDRLSAIVSTQQDVEKNLRHSNQTSVNAGEDTRRRRRVALAPLSGAAGVEMATVDLLARQVERIDALARELGVEEAATAALVERVEAMWERLAAVDIPRVDHTTTDAQRGLLAPVGPSDEWSSRRTEGKVERQPHLVPPPVPRTARGTSARTAALLSLGLLTLFSAGTVALGAWNESGSDGGKRADTTSVPAATSTRVTLSAAAPSMTVEGSSPASTPTLTPGSPTRTDALVTPTVNRPRPSPSPTLSPTPTPTVTAMSTATSTPPRQVAVADLDVGVGSSPAEVERLLGEREYVRDGESYYLDGQVAIVFDDGLARSITVTYPEPVESLSEVNELLDRLRPADARLLDAASEPDSTLRRVYASEGMQEVFGDDYRYIERVRFDSDSGDVIRVVLSTEEE